MNLSSNLFAQHFACIPKANNSTFYLYCEFAFHFNGMKYEWKWQNLNTVACICIVHMSKPIMQKSIFILTRKMSYFNGIKMKICTMFLSYSNTSIYSFVHIITKLSHQNHISLHIVRYIYVSIFQ